MFPDPVISQASVDEYNQKLRAESERIRDSLCCTTSRTNVSETPSGITARRITLPKLSHSVSNYLRTPAGSLNLRRDVFSENSWVQVMMGQGITPQRYHNIADAMSREQLDDFLPQIQDTVGATVAALPNHGDFVKQLVAMSKL